MGSPSATTARPEPGRPTVAVTGAATGLGAALLGRLARRGDVTVLGLDPDPPGPPVPAGVPWRPADVRDPLLAQPLAGVETLVHLAVATALDLPSSQRRPVNVRGTANMLRSAAAARVRRVVLVTSTMVYGAYPDNAVPLAEDAVLRAPAEDSLLGDWVEMERLAARASGRGLAVTVLRPAPLAGPGADSVVTRHFEAPRLLTLRGVEHRWQFCHVDDLLAALELAALGGVDGPAAVVADGWLSQQDVERLTGLRRVVLPAAVAVGVAERLHRLGVSPAPASELAYLAYPWVVRGRRLQAAGWVPAYDHEAALRDQLRWAAGRRSIGARRVGHPGATGVAAGATVAVAGAAVLARSRALRRHGRR